MKQHLKCCLLELCYSHAKPLCLHSGRARLSLRQHTHIRCSVCAASFSVRGHTAALWCTRIVSNIATRIYHLCSPHSSGYSLKHSVSNGNVWVFSRGMVDSPDLGALPVVPVLQPWRGWAYVLPFWDRSVARPPLAYFLGVVNKRAVSGCMRSLRMKRYMVARVEERTCASPKSCWGNECDSERHDFVRVAFGRTMLEPHDYFHLNPRNHVGCFLFRPFLPNVCYV
mmetsp:Transcript_46506/g.83144  ORF Transcript_46506/g.83144 Transcript_46506/m.83144 type:complete len:226 (+) Transcript_46506:682-1359(+)